MAKVREASAGTTPNRASHPDRKERGLRHIPELDGIRGLAALMVFGHHALSTKVRETRGAGWPHSIQALTHIFEFAGTGVDLFFVLSGFLITSILIGEKRSSSYYRDFYWKRALRILPLYWLMLGVVWIFLHQTAHTLMALAFVVNFAGIARIQMSEVGPFWSLAIEEQFYLLWRTLVRRLDVRKIFRWSIAIGLGCIALRALGALRNHHDYSLTPLRCDGLAFGAALACFFLIAGNDIGKLRRANALLWTLMGLGVALLAVRDHLPEALGLMYYPAFQTGVVLITGPIIGLAISHSGSRWLAPLRSRLLTFFGLISYAFYMVHVYVILVYQHFHGPLAPGDVRGYWMGTAVTFAASVALAVISRYVLELPAMRLRRYVLRHPHMEAEQAHPPLPLAQM